MNPTIGDQFWNRHEHRQGNPEPRHDRASRRTLDQLNDEVARLEQRIDKLTLISRALWELLERDSGLEERDLLAKLAEIDLRDGELDHRLRKPVLDCPNCGRKLNAHNRHCIYCGFQDFPHDAFDLA